MRSRISLFAALVALTAAAGQAAFAQPAGAPSDPARTQRCAMYARRQVESRGGGAVGGAIRGAIGGAAVGGIVDGAEGAGKGAAIGAGAGAIAGAPAPGGDAAYQKFFGACMRAPTVP